MPYDTGAAHLPPLAIAVPIIVASVLLVVGRRLPRPATDLTAILTAAGVVGLDAALLAATSAGRVVTWSGGWLPVRDKTVGIVLVVDPLGAGIALLAAALVFCALLYSWHYYDAAEAHYHALMLLFLAGMTGFALTGDVFDMFVFFELMGAVAYALTGFKIEDRTAVQGGINFGIINSFGAYLSLIGVGILYANTGQLGLPQLSVALRGHSPDALVVASFVLIVTGFLVKAAMVPFHFWTADAEAVAPTPVCVLFSGAMVELGVYGLARVYWVVFGDVLPHPDIRRAFVVAGALTAVVGAIMCFAQRHLKRLLAYSTIAHVGLFLFAFASLTVDGTTGGAIYIAGHAGVKSALFLLVGVLLNRYGSVDELDLFGRGRNVRVVSWLFVIGGLALAALPPFGTALGKAIAEEAVSATGYHWAPALFVLVSALTGGAVLRAAARIYFGLGVAPERDEEGGNEEETSGEEEESEVSGLLGRTPFTMLASIMLLLLGCLAVGVVPGVGAAVSVGAARFVDRTGYVAQALAHASAAPVAASPKAEWTVLGVGLGLLSAALAVLFAAIALYAPRLPVAARRLARPAVPVLTAVRALHSGHVGDYITWVLLGVAGLAALIGLPLR